MRVTHLFRYPVKGLTEEPLASVELRPKEIFSWDRAFALAQGDNPFDPANPVFIPKKYFMCLAAQAGIALLKSHFDPAARRLKIAAPEDRAIEADPFTEEGAAEIAQFLTKFLGRAARGQPRLVHAPGHNFSDDDQPVISLINQSSIEEFESRIGGERRALRFRANILIEGAAPWAERDWLGRDFRLGTATIRILRPIPRCGEPR